MLEIPAAPPIPVDTSRLHVQLVDESLTESYGEPSDSARTLGGGVDFFSTLGTEVKKKQKPDQPDPSKVRLCECRRKFLANHRNSPKSVPAN
jgi:hypothetical protein